MVVEFQKLEWYWHYFIRKECDYWLLSLQMVTHNTMEGTSIRISELPYNSSALKLPTLVNYKHITESFSPEIRKLELPICGNKMPTRCNRGFYCRSYCLLNMFRASLCPSSGAQEYYKVVAACGISCCGFQFVGLVWSWGLCVRFAGCGSILQTGRITLSSTPDQLLEKPQHEIPQAATTV